MIRITAHDYDIEDGMDFAREVKAKGYKLSINPIILWAILMSVFFGLLNK